MSMLGRSFVIGVSVRGPHIIETTKVGMPPMVPGAVAIDHVLNVLTRRLQAVNGVGVARGRTWSVGHGALESGLYIDRLGEGAVITAKCEPLAESISLTVGVSSPGLRALVWLIFLGSLVAGFAGVKVFGPEDWSRQINLLAGLVSSIGLMVPSLVGLGMLVARRPTGPLIEQLDAEVRALGHAPGTPAD
jgi:hypothetical protein